MKAAKPVASGKVVRRASLNRHRTTSYGNYVNAFQL